MASVMPPLGPVSLGSSPCATANCRPPQALIVAGHPKELRSVTVWQTIARLMDIGKLPVAIRTASRADIYKDAREALLPAIGLENRLWSKAVIAPHQTPEPQFHLLGGALAVIGCHLRSWRTSADGSELRWTSTDDRKRF